jgi:hypothetical protein
MKTKMSVFGLFMSLFLAVSAFADTKIVNLSTRGEVGVGNNVLITGFVISGTQPKQVMIRGVGPGLAQYGVTKFIAAPRLALNDSSQKEIVSVTGWDGSAATRLIALNAGAFALLPGSKDCVIIATLQPGLYTAVMSSTDANTGTGLIEVYDVTKNAGSRLINESARVVGDGNTIITGAVFEGLGKKKVYIRAVGPALKVFGVTEPMTNPSIAVYNGRGVLIATNDNWQISSLTAQLQAQVGMFPLGNDTLSAGLVLEVDVNGPTSLTIHVIGVGGSPGKPDVGTVLIEIYEVL